MKNNVVNYLGSHLSPFSVSAHRFSPIGAWNIWIEIEQRQSIEVNREQKPKSVSDVPRAEGAVPNCCYSWFYLEICGREQKMANGSGLESSYFSVNYSRDRRRDELAVRFKTIQNTRHTHIPHRICQASEEVNGIVHNHNRAWNWERRKQYIQALRMIYASSNGSARRPKLSAVAAAATHSFIDGFVH